MPGRGSTTGGTTGSPSNELFPPRRVPARIGPIAVLGRKALRRVGRGRLVNEAGIGTLDGQLRQSLRSRILAIHTGARILLRYHLAYAGPGRRLVEPCSGTHASFRLSLSRPRFPHLRGDR